MCLNSNFCSATLRSPGTRDLRWGLPRAARYTGVAYPQYHISIYLHKKAGYPRVILYTRVYMVHLSLVSALSHRMAVMHRETYPRDVPCCFPSRVPPRWFSYCSTPMSCCCCPPEILIGHGRSIVVVACGQSPLGLRCIGVFPLCLSGRSYTCIH